MTEIQVGYCQCGCGGLAPIAKQSDTRKGWIKGEPVRFIAGHHHRIRAILASDPTRIAARFWPKVDKSGGPDDCWPWTSALASGYGKFGTTRKRGPVQAHRMAWELTNGPIPDGMVVCHSCDNRRCCNPAHLWTGTIAENNADMIAKKRHSHGPKHAEAIAANHLRGTDVWNTKLTEDAVLAIRQLHKSKEWSMNQLAAIFHMNRRTISAIVHNQTWTHLP